MYRYSTLVSDIMSSYFDYLQMDRLSVQNTSVTFDCLEQVCTFCERTSLKRLHFSKCCMTDAHFEKLSLLAKDKDLKVIKPIQF